MPPAGSDSEHSDYEEADERPTSADVDRIRDLLGQKCSSVNAYLLSSREPVDKRRFIENTMQDLLTAFNQMAVNYLRVNAMVSTAGAIKDVLSKVIKKEVSSAFRLAESSTGAAYASVVSKPNPRLGTQKVKVTNGPTVVLPSTVSVVVGPKKECITKFSTAEDTRKAIMNAVKPVEVDMRVNKIVSTRNNAVRIIADTLDLEKLKRCPTLAAAGLEVKERERLNPRLIIRDVPTDLSNDDLLADIVSLNLDTKSKELVKIVYRYPSRRTDGHASVVIETHAEIRRALLSKGRISLAWQSCRIEDYLRVLQCFNCQDFGHLAKNCPSAAICGNCAGPHDTSSCTDTSVLKCVNCHKSKLSNADHKSFDTAKCPLIKRKLTEKAKNIAY